jgi:hypothetical protein
MLLTVSAAAETLTVNTAPQEPVVVVEFHNASLDHYFITWMVDEIAKLDAGTEIKGWVRTGHSFKTYASSQAGTSPVCRYYIPPGLGDSHFFGRGTDECVATGQKNPSFTLEDAAFMQMFLPLAGDCPADTTAVYRVFSNRADANHRYMTDRAIRDRMVAEGWLVEGDGPDAVVMCAPVAQQLACDESMKSAFVPDVNTTVTLVKSFRKGDPLMLAGTPIEPAPPIAANDVCLVKLNVGPGNAGPADAPSTSAGIGIEVWLPTPALWTNRLHLLGGSGWDGGTDISSLDSIGSVVAASIAGNENAVSAVTDSGHTVWQDGSFAMNPDGSINTVLWNDFARRAVHEMAIKTKALATDYYGIAPRASYFDGCSTGGRQGLMEAQAYPEDFDGILAGAPANYWLRLAVADLYPQLAMQVDTGGPIPLAKQTAAAIASIRACDSSLTGTHDGYIDEPGRVHLRSCR